MQCTYSCFSAYTLVIDRTFLRTTTKCKYTEGKSLEINFGLKVLKPKSEKRFKNECFVNHFRRVFS